MAAAHAWYVISLRPRGQHGTVRRAALRCGARMLALSTLQIRDRNDDATTRALRDALAADACIFTSPNAVRAASKLLELQGKMTLAVGEGTARALRREGAADVIAPSRMDSEGLLDLPALQEIAGRGIGLVTGSGGRGLIAATLRERGAHVLRADVYAREVAKLSPVALRRLDALDAPAALLASSGEALTALLDQLDEARFARILAMPVIVPSARLAAQAKADGFQRIAVAPSPRPSDMLVAAAETSIC